MNCKVITTGRVCCEGDLEVLLSNTTNLQNAGRWSIVFFTGGLTCSIPEKYVISSYDGTTYSNCRRVDNGNILCYFRGPKLGSGQLCYKLYLGIADSDFSPNFRDDVYPVATNYELGPWPTDSVRAELDLLVLSGIINAQIVGATAETLPAGSQATVTLGGTATERTFAFGIPAGDAGQITSATASVDSTTGTPSVNIELGGTPEKRTFDFKFSGLKGEPGNPDDSFVRYDETQNLTIAQQSQVFKNLGWKVHVISESAIGSSDAVSDDEKSARLSATALLVQETGEMYLYGHNSSSTPLERRFYRFRDTKTLALLNVVTTTGLITQPPFVNIYDENAVSFNIDQSGVSDDNKNKALGNIGIDLVRIPYSLLGTTLSDKMSAVVNNARGIILVDTPSDYRNPTVFVKGYNISGSCMFVSFVTGTTSSTFSLNKSTKLLSGLSSGLTYAGSVRYAERQNLTDVQKQQARSNIGVQSADELLADDDFIASLKTKLGIG